MLSTTWEVIMVWLCNHLAAEGHLESPVSVASAHDINISVMSVSILQHIDSTVYGKLGDPSDVVLI